MDYPGLGEGPEVVRARSENRCLIMRQHDKKFLDKAKKQASTTQRSSPNPGTSSPSPTLAPVSHLDNMGEKKDNIGEKEKQQNEWKTQKTCKNT